MEFRVLDEDHGSTLLAFLKKKCEGSFSASKLKKAIEAKACKINGRVELFASYQVMSGDQVELTLSLEKTSSQASLLFQDDYFAIIDKPSGLVSENEEVLRSLGPKARGWRLVHRLDKDTSGVLLLAKTLEAEEAGKLLFSNRSIQKIYLAIVDGKTREKQGIIDNYLGKKGGYQGQTLYGEVANGGQRAITHYQCLTQGKGASLALCDLKTGRTHQIRVHFSEQGHPLVGDYQYGKKFECSLQPKRHLLHAWKLIFTHPFTRKQIQVIAPIPEDFLEALKALFPPSTLLLLK